MAGRKNRNYPRVMGGWSNKPSEITWRHEATLRQRILRWGKNLVRWI